MAAVTGRKFFEELGQLVGKPVIVEDAAGKTYEGNLLGYLSIVEGPSQAMGWVTDLVVNLRRRRQGVASRLLVAAREWCRERGITRLFLEMQSKNYPAVCLARKMGFVFSGYSDQFYPDQDIALFFSLSLS